MSITKKVRVSVIALAIFCIAAGLWQGFTTDVTDIYLSPHYVLWKYHILPMEPRKALAIMEEDPDAANMLLGKTGPELVQRFGYVKTVADVRPYLRDYCAAARPNASVLFLNDMDMMVVMKNGRVVEYLPCEG